MSLRLPLTLLASALLVSACDRAANDEAQPQAGAAAQSQSLTGTIDRSHEGELMPLVKLTDPDGNELNSGALQGTPVLVNLWATWCAPCVVEMPMLDNLAARMKGRLRVVTVSQDMQGAKAVKPYFAKQGFSSLKPWLDPQNDLGFALGGGNLPLSVLYDGSGREIFRVAGGYEWDGEEARAQIEQGLTP